MSRLESGTVVGPSNSSSGGSSSGSGYWTQELEKQMGEWVEYELNSSDNSTNSNSKAKPVQKPPKPDKMDE